MGPTCPSCGVIYEWTENELREHVMSPRVFFCHGCRAMFTLSADEVTEVQMHFRVILEQMERAERAEGEDYEMLAKRRREARE